MQNRATQRKVGLQRKKGGPEPRTEQSSQQTPTQTFLRVRHCDSMGWCLRGDGNRWEEANPHNAWKNIKARRWTAGSLQHLQWVTRSSAALKKKKNTLSVLIYNDRQCLWKVWKQKKTSDRRNVSAREGHAVIRKTCGPLTSPANELSWQPRSPLQRPSENTPTC